MSYDPIQRAIDIQLSGILNDYRPHNPENLIAHALDLKYHFTDLREESITYWGCEGYTEQEIGGLTGFHKATICRIMKKVRI